MKFTKTLLAAAALAVSAGAGATVSGMAIGSAPPGANFLTLAGSGVVGAGGTLSGAASATIVGGTVFTSDEAFADIPAGSIFGGTFLSAGPPANNDQPAILTFDGASAGGVPYLSFLWGSPDTYNRLTVNSSDGASQMFDTANLSFSVDNGNQAFSQYVEFRATSGLITSLVFTTNPAIDAFETANYSVTPIPEPETYALMLAGLGAIGFISRRRKKSV